MILAPDSDYRRVAAHRLIEVGVTVTAESARAVVVGDRDTGYDKRERRRHHQLPAERVLFARHGLLLEGFAGAHSSAPDVCTLCECVEDQQGRFPPPRPENSRGASPGTCPAARLIPVPMTRVARRRTSHQARIRNGPASVQGEVLCPRPRQLLATSMQRIIDNQNATC